MFDNLYKQRPSGALSEESWGSNEMTVEGLLRNRSVQLWWESGFFQASPEFAKYVEDLRKSSGEASWGWVDIARVFDGAQLGDEADLPNRRNHPN